MTIDDLFKLVLRQDPTATIGGSEISAGGNIYLGSRTTLPEGVTLSAGGYIDLESLTTLPEGVTLSAGGNIYLRSLTTLPEGVTLSAGGNLYLESLATLPEGVTLSADGNLNLESLTTLPEGVTLSAGGYIYLGSLTTLPEGVTLSAGGNLYLRSLTTLPEGVTLSAGGYIYLRSLTTPSQRYKGQDVYIEQVDGFTMQRLSTPKAIGESLVWRAAYFNGRGDGERCYIAERGGFTSHGDSIATALRDIEFKQLQETFDESSLVSEIIDRGRITFSEYRLLTGACESGLRRGIAECGLPDDTDSVSIHEILKYSSGRFGGDRIRKLFGHMA